MSDLIEREALDAIFVETLQGDTLKAVRDMVRALPASTRDEARDVPAIVEVDDISAGAMVLQRGFYKMPGDTDTHSIYLRVFKQALEAAGVRIAKTVVLAWLDGNLAATPRDDGGHDGK